MKKILRYLRSSLGYLYVCFKWVILAALVGCVVGPVSYTHLTLPTIA